MEKIVFVSMDKEYIETVMGRFAGTFGKNYELEFITDAVFWEQYMKIPAEIDFLIVDEMSLQNAENRLKVRNLSILTEDSNNVREMFIYKYADMNEFAVRTGLQLTQSQRQEENKTKLISIYSSNGGCGKTLAALSIARYISRQGKKVLYLNTEMIQDFYCYMKTKDFMEESTGYQFAAGRENGVDLLLKSVKKEGFDFVPAFEKPLFAYHMEFGNYADLIMKLKEKKVYDYLVVELSQEMQAEKMNFLCKSDEMVYVCTFHEAAVSKLNKLIGITSGFQGKGALICNRMKPEGKQTLIEIEVKEKFACYEEVQEYNETVTLDFCEQNKLFMNTAYAVM